MIIAAVVLPIALLLPLFFMILRRCCSSKGVMNSIETTRIANSEEGLQSGIPKFHFAYETKNQDSAASKHRHDLDYKKRSNYYILQRELSMKPIFSWADHPTLVSEAVEHGWSRFAFSGHNMSSPSTRSKLLALCVSGDQVRDNGADISWEVSLGSAEFMQKVRLNAGMKKANLDTTPPLGVSCVTQTSLPLPGPFLGNTSFPREAYFEITVLSLRDAEGRKVKERKAEGEKVKLIQEAVNVNAPSDEFKLSVKEEDRSEAVAVSVGLSVGGSHPRRLPGSYTGSIGFGSDGSVYLEGIKLVFETKSTEWGSTDRVIGCGFDPNQKKVFFTVDSEMVHVIHCKSDEFSRPLYPTLAANMDVTVLVNFGQSIFKYEAANVHRTPNPGFTGSLAISPAVSMRYEDSRELFSIGRIDAEWLHRSTTKGNRSISIDNNKIEIDEESETDLFEIVLDRIHKSPSTY